MKSRMSLLSLSVGLLLASLAGVDSVSAMQATETATPAAAKAPEFLTMEISDKFKIPPHDHIDPKNRQAVTEWRGAKAKVETARRSYQTSISDYLKGKGGQVSNTELQEWFNDFIIPNMAQSDEKTLSELGKQRKNLFRFYITFASNDQARNQVLGLVTPKMREIVEGNYHPACRVNAMIVLAELNSREGNRQRRELPVPNNQILGYLRNVVTQDNLPAYLKVPAMNGIKRHATARPAGNSNAFSEPEANALISDMNGILAIPADSKIDSDQVAWMKRQAVQILGFIGRPAAAGTLKTLIMNDDADMRLRIDAIGSYGKLQFSKNDANADLLNVSRKIGQLAQEFAKSEAAFIDKKINDIEVTVRFLDGKDASSGSGQESRGSVGLGQGADSGGTGGAGSKTKDDIKEILPEYHRDLVRRRLQHMVWMSRYAMAGDARANPPVRGLVDVADSNSDEAELIRVLINDFDALLANTDIQVRDEDDEDDEDQDPRTESYADELKNALIAGASRIQASLDRLAPEEPAAGESDEKEESSSTGASQ